MFIQTEQTPNPQTLKFLPGVEVLNKGSAEFKNKKDAKKSKLATSLFNNEYVINVFLGVDFISITKSDKVEWDNIKPDILSKIMNFFSSDVPIMDEVVLKPKEENKSYTKKDKKIVEQIMNLLDEKIKPAVAQDGGNIRFIKFDEGIVFLELQGACAGCPSSSMTLKSGIENMLKYYIPEIVSVEAIN